MPAALDAVALIFVRQAPNLAVTPLAVSTAGRGASSEAPASFGGHHAHIIPPEDVRTDLLVPSEIRTRCPYKGEAVYWSARMPERTVEDVVWSYPRPIAECPRIASHMCFFNEVVDTILVGGVAEPKSRTRWSRD